jgi:AbrB family looped-hinge helix DNA binding protein
MEVKMARMSTVSSKGQVTIPQEVRENLGLKSGDQVEFVNDKGTIVLKPVRSDENPFLQFIGVLPRLPEGSVQWVRDMRDDIPNAMDY